MPEDSMPPQTRRIGQFELTDYAHPSHRSLADPSRRSSGSPQHWRGSTGYAEGDESVADRRNRVQENVVCPQLAASNRGSPPQPSL